MSPQLKVCGKTLNGEEAHPPKIKDSGDFIICAYAIEELWRQTKDAITLASRWVSVSTRCGPPSFRKFDRPRRY